MGTACENKTNTTADQQKDKIENVQIDIQQANRENEGSENDDLEYEKAILEINLELENQQIIKDSLKAAEDTKRISENSEKIAENTRRIARNRKNARAEMESLWANVDENVFKSSEIVQTALDEYFQWAKEN